MKKEFDEMTSDEDLVTPERLAKGDLKIGKNAKDKISAAWGGDRYIIKKLIRGGILDYYHEIYGVGFLELRAAFRSPWGAKCSAVLLEQWGKGISTSRAGEIYQNVVRGMRGRGIEVVTYALEHDSNPMKYEAGLYQEHFQRLVDLMDSERDRIFKEQNQ